MEISSTTETPAVFRKGRNLTIVSERTAEPTPKPDAALARKEAELTAALATVKTAFAILGSRALVILTAAASAAAFGWALLNADLAHIAAASLFTAFVFWPSLYAARS